MCVSVYLMGATMCRVCVYAGTYVCRRVYQLVSMLCADRVGVVVYVCMCVWVPVCVYLLVCVLCTNMCQVCVGAGMCVSTGVCVV